jgi:hypothetical protein
MSCGKSTDSNAYMRCSQESNFEGGKTILIDFPHGISPAHRPALGTSLWWYLYARECVVRDSAKPLHTRIEMARAKFEGLPPRGLGQASWQFVNAGHPHPFNQKRDDADITYLSCPNL